MKLFMPLYELLVGMVLLCFNWLVHYFNFLMQYSILFLFTGWLMVAIAVTSIILLIRKRGLRNYLKSLVDTNRFRQFLRQQNSINEFTSKKNINIDQRIYNSALWYTYIDYTSHSMNVWVCIPNNFKAKKLLDSNLDNIAQEVSSYTNKYICSTYTRKGSFYHYHGEKK